MEIEYFEAYFIHPFRKQAIEKLRILDKNIENIQDIENFFNNYFQENNLALSIHCYRKLGDNKLRTEIKRTDKKLNFQYEKEKKFFEKFGHFFGEGKVIVFESTTTTADPIVWVIKKAHLKETTLTLF